MKQRSLMFSGPEQSRSGILPLSKNRPKRLEAASTSRAGLTLLELLVVLAIIAVIAGIALRTVSGTFDQSRYQANIAQVDAIETAILGPAGFLHDIGRLPEAQGTEPRTQLSELWSQETLPAFTIAAAPGDPEVQMGVGWRGPYLRLGLGRNDLRDAFGRDYELFAADGATLPVDTEIGLIRSLGADGQIGGTDFDADVLLVLAADADAVAAGLVADEIDRSVADLIIRVHRETLGEPVQVGEGNRVLVRVYGPTDGTLETLAAHTFTVGSPAILQHIFAGLPLGPKVIRAYQADFGNLPTDDETPFATAPTWRSVPMPILLDRQTSALPVELILRNF